MSIGRASRKTILLAVATTSAVMALGVSLALTLWPAPGGREMVEPPAAAVEQWPSVRVAPSMSDAVPDGRRSGPAPLWRVIDPGSAEGTPPYPESWSETGRVLVDVTAAASRADAWRVGDRLAVELPASGGLREWTVERIDAGLDGRSRSARGWIDNPDARPRRIVVTVGPGRVLAYVDTPAGPYELTGNARLAWLLPSSNMMAGVDFSRPDYMLPDGEEERR